MFERFTSQSRRAVTLAQEESRDLRHDYIGTEHILLGLVREGTGSAARVLASMDVTLDAVRREVEATVGRGDREQSSGHIPFTPPAKKSLERSLRESMQLGSGYIGTGHLLLGLISETGDLAFRILDRLGTDLGDLRARVTRDIREHPEQQEAGVFRSVRARVHPETLRPSLEVQNLLAAIDARLSAIERHLGIAPAAQEGRASETPEATEAAEAEAGGSGQAGDGPDEPGDRPVAAG